MNIPLLERLQSRYAYPLLDKESYDYFVYGHDDVVLFFTNDPLLFPETNDVAVILPELVNAFDGRLHAAVVERSIERELQARFRFTSWPSLVFLRKGAYLGAITGIRDWLDYREEISTILASEPCEPPVFDFDKVCGATING